MIKRHPKLASALGHDPEAQDYKAKLAMDQKTYFQYYIQDDVEDGTLMDTKIPMPEVFTLLEHVFQEKESQSQNSIQHFEFSRTFLSSGSRAIAAGRAEWQAYQC